MGPRDNGTQPPPLSLSTPFWLLPLRPSHRFRGQSSRDARPKSFPRFAERGGRRRLREARVKPQTPMAAPAPCDVAVLLLLLFPVLAPVASAVPFVVLHGWGFSCLASILIHFVLGPFLICVWVLGVSCRDWRRVRERWVALAEAAGFLGIPRNTQLFFESE